MSNLIGCVNDLGQGRNTHGNTGTVGFPACGAGNPAAPVLGPFSKWSTVQKKQCATCIYRADSGFELKKLEAEVEIADRVWKDFLRVSSLPSFEVRVP